MAALQAAQTATPGRPHAPHEGGSTTSRRRPGNDTTTIVVSTVSRHRALP